MVTKGNMPGKLVFTKLTRLPKKVNAYQVHSVSKGFFAESRVFTELHLVNTVNHFQNSDY
jgi:hypothetical protein